jgi:hypothetical protein
VTEIIGGRPTEALRALVRRHGQGELNWF